MIVTFVFLTIGTANGRRLSVSNSNLSASNTITEFDDFIWKEEELTKTETRQKSGRYWLGRTLPASSQNQMIEIFKDTLPDVNTSVPILTSGRIYLRSTTTTSFEMNINEQPFREFSILKLDGSEGYTSYTVASAKPYSFTNSVVNIPTNDDVLSMDLMMKNTDSGGNSFVDYLRFVVRRKLTAERNKLFFFPPSGGSSSDLANYTLNGFSSLPYVMDVTNPMEPLLLEVSQQGSTFNLVYHTDPESKIIAQSSLSIPRIGTKVPNQNLHGISTYPDYVVITSDFFLDRAQELADYRSERGLNPVVVTQSQILNEFSSGATDPTSIRDFLKHLWDSALANGQVPPKYVLLFGDTTYDTKNIVSNAFNNYVLTYQTSESIHRTDSFGSDDYFGLMDDNEGLLNSSARVDLGIGRISAQTRSEAAIAIDKIKRYENPANFGDWQNLFAFAADDDFPEPTINRDLHVENADGTLRRMNLNDAGGRSKKIYLFDYKEEITGVGRQFPTATNDFLSTISNGALVMNYSGHGNTQNLTDEELYSSDYLTQLTNRNRLTLFVTATCQFGRYDDINAQSGAEKLVFADNGGAIASFTTTRVVYTSSNPNSLNFGLNIELSQNMLERDEEGRPLPLGDIFLRTKNTSVGSQGNNRKFILLGDPALRLALPDKKAQIEQINGLDVASEDTIVTIKALDQVTLNGTILNSSGELESTFNGEVTVSLFDAPRTVSIPQDRPWIETRGCNLNSNTSAECTYQIENDILFKGKTLAQNGTYSITFIIPKDISFSPDQGRIIVYANSNETTAGGSYTNVIFNGVNTNALNDGKGPAMDIYLNDQTFINGSLANDSPKLIVELADSSGINTTGTGVGHEIIATIDTKPQQTFVLNNFYEGNLNDYTSGRIEYPLENIPEGNYALKVRAWDVHNNPSEKEVFFQVADQEDLIVDNIYNYPNPMNNRTSFTFEHNQQGNPLDVDIRIYTLSGKPVQRIQEYIPPSNTLSSYASIPWNGRDRDNDRLGNGTYIYVLRVTTDTTEGRKTTEKIEKLVIIR
ncbi:MAG: type IX secretion system sortase PorU [Balneolaceae bacterium]